MANFLNQDTTTIGLPAGCVGHDIHFTGLQRDQYYNSWETFQPSYLPEIQIWLVSGYSSLIESRKENEGLQHNLTRCRCEILGEWTAIASSKTWSGSATNLWTRYPRWAWPRSSLIVKHYRVQKGNHHRGCRSLVHDLGLAQQLLFLEQINQWLGVLRNPYGVEVINLPNHRILRTYA